MGQCALQFLVLGDQQDTQRLGQGHILGVVGAYRMRDGQRQGMFHVRLAFFVGQEPCRIGRRAACEQSVAQTAKLDRHRGQIGDHFLQGMDEILA